MNAFRVKKKPLQSIGWQADQWERMLHDARSKTGWLAEAEGKLGDVVFETISRLVAGGDEHRDPIRLSTGAKSDLRDGTRRAVGLLGRGLYSMFYGFPLDEKGGPRWANELSQVLKDVPDLDELEKSTKVDADMSALATIRFLEESKPIVEEIIERIWAQGQDPNEQQGGGDQQQQQGGQGQGDGSGQPGQGEGDGQGEGQDDQGPGNGDLSRAMGSAVPDAILDIEKAKGQLNGCLPGLGTAPPEHRQASNERMELLEKIREGRTLGKLLRLAGRMKRIAARVRREDNPEGVAEVINVERGGEIHRMLPSELLNFGIEGLEHLALARIAERTMLQWQTRSRDPLGMGPIVVLLDSSGSMGRGFREGMSRMDWAAAIGIAAVQSAVKQRRDVRVASFDYGIRESWKPEWKDLSACRKAVLEMSGMSPGGGTQFDDPINWALDQGAEKIRADLVLVTDGEADISDKTLARLMQAKKSGLRVWGVLIGGRMSTMSKVCNDVADLNRSDNPADAINRLGDV